MRWAAVAFAAALSAAGLAQSAPLVADLSSKEIAITTGFAGTDLLLFGALDGAGDVVVVVRGPSRRETVRRKERVAGIWLNGEAVSFDHVPGFYFVASSRAPEMIAREEILRRHQIGIARLNLPAVRPPESGTVEEFRNGLVRAMQSKNLYSITPAVVTILDNRLFRTEIGFPANVPTGVYTADVFLFRNGRVASMTRTPVIVRKAGIEARIYDFAHEQSALYGLIAIVIALVAGWTAGAIFRKA